MGKPTLEWPDSVRDPSQGTGPMATLPATPSALHYQSLKAGGRGGEEGQGVSGQDAEERAGFGKTPRRAGAGTSWAGSQRKTWLRGPRSSQGLPSQSADCGVQGWVLDTEGWRV